DQGREEGRTRAKERQQLLRRAQIRRFLALAAVAFRCRWRPDSGEFRQRRPHGAHPEAVGATAVAARRGEKGLSPRAGFTIPCFLFSSASKLSTILFGLHLPSAISGSVWASRRDLRTDDGGAADQKPI